MSARHTLPSILLGALLLPASAAGGQAACDAFRVVYVTTQPMALLPEGTVMKLLGFRTDLVGRLRTEEGREVLTRHASGVSRVDRRYLIGDGKYLGISPEGLPIISYRLLPYAETEWIFPNQARIYRDGLTGRLRFKPGLTAVPPMTYVMAQAKAFIDRYAIERTGSRRQYAGRMCEVYGNLHDEKKIERAGMKVTGCVGRVQGFLVLLHLRLELVRGGEVTSMRPYEIEAVSIAEGLCLGLGQVVPKPVRDAAATAGSRPAASGGGWRP